MESRTARFSDGEPDPTERGRMLVSVCICTHNRLADVQEGLGALVPQLDPAVAEILLVDSASRREVHDTLLSVTSGIACVRLIRLERPGLSVARNAAVAAARGRWIAFLDDDAVPFPDYFAALCTTIARLEPDVAVFGGRLKPRWPAGARGVGARWSQLLSLIDDTAERETELGMIYGANIVYRRDVLARLTEPFDRNLGRIGRCLLSGEELGLHLQLSEWGYRALFVGSVGAEHKVPAERLRLRWLRERAFWQGITLVAVLRGKDGPLPRGARVSWQLLKIVALAPRLLVSDRDRDAYIRIWQSLGVLRARLAGVPRGTGA